MQHTKKNQLFNLKIDWGNIPQNSSRGKLIIIVFKIRQTFQSLFLLISQRKTWQRITLK